MRRRGRRRAGIRAARCGARRALGLVSAKRPTSVLLPGALCPIPLSSLQQLA
jgi:hypothetical protein